MKILIIGPLGAGKSSLAYAINKKYCFPRLNLDEVQRIEGGGYRSEEEQFAILKVSKIKKIKSSIYIFRQIL